MNTLTEPRRACFDHKNSGHDPVCHSCRFADREEEFGNVPGTGGGNVPEAQNHSSRTVLAGEESSTVPDRRSSGDERAERSGNGPGTFPRPQYFDVAAMLDGTLPEPPTPDVCSRTDGIGLFYRDQYNVVFGDPEGGKTLLTDYTTVCELDNGGRALRLDLDHNGPHSTIGRLIAMGAPADVLRDPARFLYIEPEDRRELHNVAAHMESWRPTLVVLDSIGELLPMFGSSSNSADEFTDCHRTIIKPLVRTGACVIGIDHLSKGSDSRAFGPGGTIAKTRAIGGSSIRVTVDVPFTPGKGGSAFLAINKDRHGGLRQHSPTGDKEPLAGKFVIWPGGDGGMRPEVKAPTAGECNPGEAVPEADISAFDALDPPPTTIADARARLNWRNTRVSSAFKEWQRRKAHSDTAERQSRHENTHSERPLPMLDGDQDTSEEVMPAEPESALSVIIRLHESHGLSFGKIARYLNDHGIRPSKADRWSEQLVGRHYKRHLERAAK